MVIPELIRLMVERGFEMDEAIEAVTKACAYTNHTILVPVDEIIFFQTEGEFIKAHTRNDMFNTKHKLYELEQLLPHYFIRISKSAIVNSKEIYAITRNLTASSKIEFKDTYKHIFVSRGYYKPLKSKIEEMRNIR